MPDRLDVSPADYADHRDAVFAMLRVEFGQLLDDHEREDVFQTAWLALLEDARNGVEVRNRLAYLKTVAWRRARDRVRNASATPVDPTDGPLSAVVDEQPSPEQQASARADAALCHELLATLRPQERTVVALRYGWELKPREIQAALGIRRARYNKLVQRAMDRLAAGAQLAEEPGWGERHLELLIACEAGTASAEERERAARLVADDPACRAALGELRRRARGVAAIAPLPILFDGARAALAARAVEALDALRSKLSLAAARAAAALPSPSSAQLARPLAVAATGASALGGVAAFVDAAPERATPDRAVVERASQMPRPAPRATTPRPTASTRRRAVRREDRRSARARRRSAPAVRAAAPRRVATPPIVRQEAAAPRRDRTASTPPAAPPPTASPAQPRARSETTEFSFER